MGGNKLLKPVQPDDTGSLVSFLRDTVRHLQLAWRLLWDERVPAWTKLIPLGTLIYLLSPLDISTLYAAPDVVPVIGQLDDLTLVLLGIKLFTELAPPEVVREHLLALGARIKEWRAEEKSPPTPVVDIVEGEYQLIEPQAASDEVSEVGGRE